MRIIGDRFFFSKLILRVEEYYKKIFFDLISYFLLNLAFYNVNQILPLVKLAASSSFFITWIRFVISFLLRYHPPFSPEICLSTVYFILFNLLAILFCFAPTRKSLK